jgi:aminoglycoside phosphotransferase (APT) family kinase protein
MRTSLRSLRVTNNIIRPLVDEDEIKDHLLSPASRYSFDSTTEYIHALKQANTIRKYPHRVSFTHGDIEAQYVLVGADGHLSGFLDWEYAGWYPEY